MNGAEFKPINPPFFLERAPVLLQNFTRMHPIFWAKNDGIFAAISYHAIVANPPPCARNFPTRG